MCVPYSVHSGCVLHVICLITLIRYLYKTTPLFQSLNQGITCVLNYLYLMFIGVGRSEVNALKASIIESTTVHELLVNLVTC